MNKKLLLFLLPLFLFMNNVYAFELPEGAVISNSANKNLMKPADWEVVGFKSYNDHTLVPRAEIGTAYNNATRYVSEVLIPVNSKSKVCFSQEEKIYTSYLAIRQLTVDFDYLNNAATRNIYPFSVPGDSPCFTTLDGTAYLVLEVSSSNLANAKSANFQVEYDSVTAYVPYEEAIIEEPEPEEPEPFEPLEGMEVITNFYSVFTDGLVSFLDFVSSNYAMLSILAIIVLFIALELFFKIFRR